MSRRSTRHLTFDAELLKAIRAEQGITHEELARRANVTLRTVQRWQDGESEPRGAQLLNLANALGVDPDSLYAETEVEDDAA